MNALVRPYVVSRGLRVAGVVILGVLGIVAVGALPRDPAWVLLRLLVLLGGLLWAFRTLKTPTLSFFLITLVVLLLFHLPLGRYVDALFDKASSRTAFMIILFGGTLAVVSRQDLLTARPGAPDAMSRSPEQTRLALEVAVMCLLRRWDAWMQRTVTSTFWRGVLLFPLVLANFVSSAPAVLFFKSLWTPPDADFRMREADRALAVGILCLCTSGVLLVYAGANRLMSPWWLFFTTAVADSPSARLPHWPVAVYLYGLLSFAHGVWLVFGRSRSTVVGDHPPVVDAHVQRLQGLYLVLTLVCLVGVGGAFVGIAMWGQESQVNASQAAAPLPVPNPSLADTQTTLNEQTPVQTAQSKPPDQRRVLSAVFVGLLLAVLLAQGLMYSLFLRPAEDVWQPSTFWNLMLQGMQGVFGTVVTLVVILSFKDILTMAMKDLAADPVMPQALGMPLQWGVLGIIFALTFGIGRLIGTAWGTFTVGLLLFAISGLHFKYVETVVEALIVLATWINQSSLNADNVQMMLGPEQWSRDTLRAVWSVPTMSRYPKLQAQHVQYAILAISILIALLCRASWPHLL